MELISNLFQFAVTLLGAAITFHAIYNLLIAYGSAAQYIAYLLPVLILAAGKLIFRSSIQ